MCSYLTFIDVAFPSNTEIYISNFRQIVDFEFLKPNKILELFNDKWSVEYFTNQVKQSSKATKELITSNMASSGIKSTDFVENMNQYLFSIVLAFLLVLIILLLMIIKPIRV